MFQFCSVEMKLTLPVKVNFVEKGQAKCTLLKKTRHGHKKCTVSFAHKCFI